MEKSEQKNQSRKYKRGKCIQNKTIKIVTGCGKMYCIIGHDKKGNPVEIITNLGKKGGCTSSNTEALSRLISLNLKNGVSPREIIKHCSGISCHKPFGFGDNKVLSCSDAIATALTIFLDGGSETQEHEPETKTCSEESSGCCPECGSVIIRHQGCWACSDKSCDWTQCD